MFARLRGVEEKQIEEDITNLMKGLLLDDHINKLCGNLRWVVKIRKQCGNLSLCLLPMLDFEVMSFTNVGF